MRVVDYAQFAWNKFGSLRIPLWCNALSLIVFNYALHICSTKPNQSLHGFPSQSYCALVIATVISKIAKMIIKIYLSLMNLLLLFFSCGYDPLLLNKVCTLGFLSLFYYCNELTLVISFLVKLLTQCLGWVQDPNILPSCYSICMYISYLLIYLDTFRVWRLHDLHQSAPYF